ncbi:unnamed protein product [Mytilus coruscus]|uniref:VLIG-type G domain-containing protein n=1 Tax=Mytilus coruscus TaxID=42192 RepID=A0A6J8BC82_MYTCO|nr:unnamed protein product [Mytilus coruscus]
MCPVNPGYSENVTKVRNAILDLTPKRDAYHTVTNTIARIKDLWEGILADDFVFSFRNSLELKAYNNTERKCRSLTWELEKLVFEFIRSDTERRLVNCKHLKDLDGVIVLVIKELTIQVNSQVTSMFNDLDVFINGNTLKEVMIQWTPNKKIRFKIQSEELLAEAKGDIYKRKEEIRFEITRISEQTKHEMEINEMARQLAIEMKGISPTETVLKQKFDEKWNTWMVKFATTDDRGDVSIKDQIQSMLCNEIASAAAFVAKTNKFDEKHYEVMKILEGSIPFNWILDECISIKGCLIWKKDTMDNCKKQAFRKTNAILRKIDTKLLEHYAQDKRFNMSYVAEIVQLINEDIDDHNRDKDKYTFTLISPYRAMMLAHVVRYAAVVFTRLNDAYNRKHSLKAQMHSYKGTAWALFENLVQSKTEDFIALRFFREAITKIVIDHVSGLIPFDAQESIVSLFANGKFSLIKDILKHIAQTECFENIKPYIEDPCAFAEDWIFKLTNKKLFENESDGNNVFTKLAKYRISKIFSQLFESVLQATQEIEFKISTWIDTFVKHSNDSKGLPLSIAAFTHVKNRNVIDLKNFVSMLKEQLSEMENDVLDRFREQTANTFKWKTHPVISIMNKIWGCSAVCMFCKEPCMNTDKDHVKDGHPHKCLQHRPEGVGGMMRVKNEKLVEDFCNHSVDSDASYQNVRGKSGQYKDYKKDFPDWEIAPNSDVSKYWIWFFCKFKKQLREMHYAELPDVPVNWDSISMHEAIYSLG